MKDKRYNAYQYKIERDHERATFLRAKLENAEKHWRESRVAMIEAEHSEVRKLLTYHLFIFTFPMLFSVLLFMLMTFYLLRPFHCQHNVMPSLVTKLRFELMTQRRHNAHAEIRHFLSNCEAHNGIDEFEKITRRLGIGGNDVEPPPGKVLSTAVESALAYLERVEETQRRMAMTTQEANEMVNGLRDKAKASRMARRERERRRRKVMVDQTSAAQEVELKNAGEKLLGGLVSEGKYQRIVSSNRWEEVHEKSIKIKNQLSITAMLKEEADAETDKAMDRLVDDARRACVESKYLNAATKEKKKSEKASLQNKKKRIVLSCVQMLSMAFYGW